MQIAEQDKKEMSGRRGSVGLRPAAVLLSSILLLFCLLHGSARTVCAQLPEPPLPVDPRPLTQLISDAEKALLAEESNPKKLVEVYLKISDAHLQAASTAIKAENQAAAERELDVYNKAVAEAGKLAFGLRDGKRGVSKKIEQSLYRQIKLLETIDRLFPVERKAFSDAALKHAKQLRVQALNEAFASGDVLKDPDAEKKPRTEPDSKDSPPKDSAHPLRFAVSGSPRQSPNLSRSMLSGNAAYSRFAVSRPQIPGDYLTEEEDDHVREAQAADARVKVFMKIADRRIKALTGPAPAPVDKKDQKKAEEEEREWGALPKVSRTELLRHYARAISECMAKLEDAYERNPKSSLLPKALATLRDSTDKHLQTLKALEAEMKNESESAALREAVDQAETANQGARSRLK